MPAAPGSSSPRIALLRSKVTTIIRIVENDPTTRPHMPENIKSRGFILLIVDTPVREDILRFRVIYLFYKGVESVKRDIMHRFLKALFVLVVLVHTGNKVI